MSVIFSQFVRPPQPSLTQIEIAYLPGSAPAAWSQSFLQSLEKAGRTSRVYRGKSLSFGADAAYTGMQAEMEVHKIDRVEREDVILAPATMAKIDQHVFEFDRRRTALKALGQSTRKGVLLYGPPGTGKTHVIRYVTSNLPEHTTVLITAEDIRNLSAYMTLARTLQPSIVVIEDVDLIGRSRESLHSPGAEALLNRLLNEMDGLRPDADILFILTTNRPEEIEAALATRPGRVDAAIEIPRPDADCRARLIAHYGRALRFDEGAVDQAIGRSDGASAAFVKEVVRRLAQRSLMMERGGRITLGDVTAVLDDATADADGIGSRLIGLAPIQA